jgi:dTDP-4-amino-4,6-dideoxygalactose transaminase
LDSYEKGIILRVLIDTDVLSAFINDSRHSNSENSSFERLMKTGLVELWLSAQSIYNLSENVKKNSGETTVWNDLKKSLHRFSVIPLRKQFFKGILNDDGQNFHQGLQAAAAQSINLDFIVTFDPETYSSLSVKAITPSQLDKALNAEKAKASIQVPFMDLKAQYTQIYNEIDDNFTDIMANTGFILGKFVDEFEKRFAELQQSESCIGVSSGTDALHAALMTLGVGPGDRVVVPINTFIATAEAVSLAGAEPVFVDCDEYFNMDVIGVEKLLKESEYRSQKAEDLSQDSGVRSQNSEFKEQALGAGVHSSQLTIHDLQIKGIIPVHLYGQPANMDAIKALAEKYNLWVVEDCCQAHLAEWKGKKVGNFGKFGAFSFYPGKNLGAFGEAGALITNDEELYKHAKMVRQHGEIERYHHKVIGHNYRMSAFQGAVLSTKAKYIEEWTEHRRKNAALYNEFLADVKEVQTPKELDGTRCVYHLYVIQTEQRDELQAYLGEKNIGTGLHYPIPLHLQEAYAHLGYKEGDFPVAERAAERILSLPMFPELTERQIRYVCDKIKAFYE